MTVRLIRGLIARNVQLYFSFVNFQVAFNVIARSRTLERNQEQEAEPARPLSLQR